MAASTGIPTPRPGIPKATGRGGHDRAGSAGVQPATAYGQAPALFAAETRDSLPHGSLTPGIPAARSTPAARGRRKLAPRTYGAPITNPDQTRYGGRGSVGAGRGGRPQAGALLKYTPHDKSTEDSSESVVPWKELRSLNAMLSHSLDTLGLHKLSDDVKECHSSFHGWECSANHRWAQADRGCRVRLCSFEMKSKARRIFHRMKKPVSALVDPRYLVLTVKNAPLGGLAESVDGLFASFGRLRRTKFWKWVCGAVCVLEVTWHPAEWPCRVCDKSGKSLAGHKAVKETWHPHLNIIFDGPFLPQRDVSAAWRKATRGEGEIVWIERLCCRRSILTVAKVHSSDCGSDVARVGATMEVFKYVTKLADIASVPEAVGEFLSALGRLRFVRGYGSLFGLGEEDEFKLACPDCGTRDVRRLGFIPLCAVELDAQGVLRFDDSFLVGADSSPPPLQSSLSPVELPTWPAPEFPLSNPAMGESNHANV